MLRDSKDKIVIERSTISSKNMFIPNQPHTAKSIVQTDTHVSSNDTFEDFLSNKGNIADCSYISIRNNYDSVSSV